MNKYTVIIIFIIAVMGCDDILNKTPKTDISPINFWKTESDFKMAANALYNSIANDYAETKDLQTDDYYGRSVNAISAGIHVPPNTDIVWTTAYATIRRANDIIENAEKSELEVSIKDRYVAEALFFRSFQYATLIKRFGDIPLVIKTLDISDKQLYSSRDPRREIVEKVIDDLQWAAEKLPKKQDLSNEDQGRITRGTALSLISRISLYEGTWIKYHNKGDYSNLLETAKSTSLSVIEEKEFSLYPNFLDQFKEVNEGNSETILRVFYKENITGVAPRTRGLILDANMSPTKNLADAFLCIDGLPIEFSELFQGYNDILSEFIDRDPRMLYTIYEPLSTFENNAPPYSRAL